MLRAASCVILLTVVEVARLAPGTAPASDERPAQTQPTTSTAPAATQPIAPRTLRRPAQAEIIENLLRDRDRGRLLVPPVITSRPATGPALVETGRPEESPLLVDGTVLVERPGRLVREDGRPMFVFLADADQVRLQSMELLPNQLLEAMEHEAERGQTEFVISARVTAYRGRNYLLLLKVLRRTPHGNLAP